MMDCCRVTEALRAASSFACARAGSETDQRFRRWASSGATPSTIAETASFSASADCACCDHTAESVSGRSAEIIRESEPGALVGITYRQLDSRRAPRRRTALVTCDLHCTLSGVRD